MSSYLLPRFGQPMSIASKRNADRFRRAALASEVKRFLLEDPLLMMTCPGELGSFGPAHSIDIIKSSTTALSLEYRPMVSGRS